MQHAALYDREFKSRPARGDHAAAQRMVRRMHAGVIYTLRRSGAMRFDCRTRLFQLHVYDPAAEQALVAASGDGTYIALLGLLNYDRNGWVAQTTSRAQGADQTHWRDSARVEVLRFGSADEAEVYYIRSRSLCRAVSPPFQNAHGVWCVTYIHRRA